MKEVDILQRVQPILLLHGAKISDKKHSEGGFSLSFVGRIPKKAYFCMQKYQLDKLYFLPNIKREYILSD